MPQTAGNKHDGICKALCQAHADQNHHHFHDGKQDQRNHDLPVQLALHLIGISIGLCIDVVDVGAGINDPVIGFEVAYISAFGGVSALTGLGERVVHEAAACVSSLEHFLQVHDTLAVLVLGAVLAFYLGSLDRVHHAYACAALVHGEIAFAVIEAGIPYDIHGQLLCIGFR